MRKIIGFICLCMMVTSCGKMFKSQCSDVDSSLYLNKNIQYGDSAYNLVERGLATPDIKYSFFYNLRDVTLDGISFERATANLNDSNIVVQLEYSVFDDDEFVIKAKVDSLSTICFRKYGKPIKDSTYVEKDWTGTEKEHKFDFSGKYKVISVSLYNNDYCWGKKAMV